MELLFLTLSPFIVAILTNALKPLKGKKILNENRKTVLRFSVAVLSFVTVIGSSVLAGTEVNLVEIETFTNSLLIFLGSTGVYFLNK